jgi:phosphoribosylanthranilate isomerase
MINGITLKICGICSVNDAVAAAGVGADYLGFVFHPESPRHVSEAKFQRMVASLPATRRVAVLAAPSPADLTRVAQLGFDAVQIHFEADTAETDLQAWADAARPRKLWLAPRLKPEAMLSPACLELADAILLDCSAADFKRHARAQPAKTWILSGPLHPDTIVQAVNTSDALFIDLDAGVEESPGIKSQEKLFALWRALERL